MGFSLFALCTFPSQLLSSYCSFLALVHFKKRGGSFPADTFFFFGRRCYKPLSSACFFVSELLLSRDLFCDCTCSASIVGQRLHPLLLLQHLVFVVLQGVTQVLFDGGLLRGGRAEVDYLSCGLLRFRTPFLFSTARLVQFLLELRFPLALRFKLQLRGFQLPTVAVMQRANFARHGFKTGVHHLFQLAPVLPCPCFNHLFHARKGARGQGGGSVRYTDHVDVQTRVVNRGGVW